MSLKFTGLDCMNEDELDDFSRISERSYSKIERLLPNADIILKVKKHEKEGKRSKISIKANINSPEYRLSAQAFDWDISKVTHKIFTKLENELHRATKR